MTAPTSHPSAAPATAAGLPLLGLRALVGGASRGIGRAIAEVMAEQGASVVLMARSEDLLARIVAALPSPHGQAHSYLAVDYDNADEVVRSVEARLADAGPALVLVNNTGGPLGGPIAEATPEAFRDAYEKHLIVNHRLTQVLLPGMRAARYGRIINVLSTSVYEPIPGLGVSNTTRWAVAAWAKTLAREVAAEGITVNNVLPGYTATDRLETLMEGRAQREGRDVEAVRAAWLASVPAGRFGQPREIANAVAFLASPPAAYVNGVNLPVDGGRLGSM